MTFQQAVSTCFSKYATFSGRAPRSEYWWWVLFSLLGNLVTGLADTIVFGSGPGSAGVLSPLFGLAVFLPGLAVTARRLHDGGKSGWWQVAPFGLMLTTGICVAINADILAIAAGIGAAVTGIVLLVWMIRIGDAGGNRFGPDPLGGRPPPPPPDDRRYVRSSIPSVPRDPD